LNQNDLVRSNSTESFAADSRDFSNFSSHFLAMGWICHLNYPSDVGCCLISIASLITVTPVNVSADRDHVFGFIFIQFWPTHCFLHSILTI
jgi:hypothetical protein